MELHFHPTKSALQYLLPDAHVTGGSFAEVLPPASSISAKERRSLLQDTLKDAVEATVNELLSSVDVEKRAPLHKSPNGNRTWPNGYVGSVAHKGTVVLGAISQDVKVQSIGIDVELDQQGGIGLSHIANSEETPPNMKTSLSTLAAFSCKEATYKSFYPVKEQVIGFDDINLSWNESTNICEKGIAECPDSIEIEVQCTTRGNWVISAAQFLNTR